MRELLGVPSSHLRVQVWRVKQEILCQVGCPMYKVLVLHGGADSKPAL